MYKANTTQHMMTTSINNSISTDPSHEPSYSIMFYFACRVKQKKLSFSRCLASTVQNNTVQLPIANQMS